MTELKQDVYICSAARTAIGNYNGSLARIPATTLGSIVIREALVRANIDASAIDECFMGCVLTGGVGQAPARQAWFGAGGLDSVPCTTVGKVCGSGMQAVIFASRGLKLNEFSTAVAGGMENMSAAGVAVPSGSTSIPEGTPDMVTQDGLWDPYSDSHMGTICDRVAFDQNISRQAQDDYAIMSYERAIASAADGSFQREIVPVNVVLQSGEGGVFAVDEGPRSFKREKIPQIRAAFRGEKGTITAANASSINDGAAALVLANTSAIAAQNLVPLAKIVSWGAGAVAPDQFPFGPVTATKRALQNADLKPSDIDVWEINEAFAVVPLLAMRELGLSVENVNVLGGAVAIGHPIGASGARILCTLINALQMKGGRLGAAALCIGGGEGLAMIIERV